MSSEAPTFRLRRAGQIFGPYPRTRIRLMARRGEVALTDELSLNGGQWIPVGQTPLAAEIPRKAAVVLREPSRGKSGGDSSVVAPAGASGTFPTVRRSDSSIFFSRNLVERSVTTGSGIQTGKVQLSAPAAEVPQPVQQDADPFAHWAQGQPVYTSRHAVRRRVRRGDGGGGFGLEVFLLGILVVMALMGIIGAAFWFGRQSTPAPATPVVVAQVPVAASPPPAPVSADWRAFVGNTYGLWEAQGATSPTVRFRLMSDGRIDVVDSSISSVQEASKWLYRWTLEEGSLVLYNEAGHPANRFPNAQPRQRDMVGTYFDKTWRRITLESR